MRFYNFEMENEIIERNHETVDAWKEFGGVLGYNYWNGCAVLYIMDDGEFEDRWRDKSFVEETTYPGITKENYARILCETTLRKANCSDEEISSLMDW